MIAMAFSPGICSSWNRGHCLYLPGNNGGHCVILDAGGNIVQRRSVAFTKGVGRGGRLHHPWASALRAMHTPTIVFHSCQIEVPNSSLHGKDKGVFFSTDSE
jgi:hypothetical protein